MTTKTKSRKSKPARHPDLVALGSRIREERHHRGMTQKALAEDLGVSIAYVSLIERAGRNSPFTTVVAISKALGVPVSKLVG